jgi:hypothetical protein
MPRPGDYTRRVCQVGTCQLLTGFQVPSPLLNSMGTLFQPQPGQLKAMSVLSN